MITLSPRWMFLLVTLATVVCPPLARAFVQPENTALFLFPGSRLPSDVSGYRAIAEGDFAIAVRRDGRMDAWVPPDWQSAAVRVTNAVDAAVGSHGWTVLRSDGTVEFGGVEGYPPVIETPTSAPFPVNATNLVAIAEGDEHTLMLSASGRVFATGKNTYLQCRTAADG